VHVAPGRRTPASRKSPRKVAFTEAQVRGFPVTQGLGAGSTGAEQVCGSALVRFGR